MQANLCPKTAYIYVGVDGNSQLAANAWRGSGTPSDPYVYDPSPGQLLGLFIENTNAYAVIQGFNFPDSNITLQNCSNIMITRCAISGPNPIDIAGCSNITVTGCTIEPTAFTWDQGITLEASNSCVISTNVVESSQVRNFAVPYEDCGFEVDSCINVSLVDNDIWHVPGIVDPVCGIVVSSFCTNTLVEGNSVTDMYAPGIYDQGVDTNMTGNFITLAPSVNFTIEGAAWEELGSITVPQGNYFYNVTTGTPLAFSVVISGGQAPFNCSWNFGDNSSASGVLGVTHVYAPFVANYSLDTENMNVTVTITDAEGAVGTCSYIVQLTNANVPPPQTVFSLSVTAGLSAAGVVAGLAVGFFLARRKKVVPKAGGNPEILDFE
jgi:hypothetical protein